MIVAGFHHEADLSLALTRLRDAGIGPVETYTPAPLPDADTASPIPFVILLAALLGGAASFGLQAFSSTVAYPLNVGGRPALAWPSFIPTTFENAVLVAMIAGFASFLFINRLPLLYDRVDEADSLRQASSDLWCLSLDADTATLDQARLLLRAASAAQIEDLPS